MPAMFLDGTSAMRFGTLAAALANVGDGAWTMVILYKTAQTGQWHGLSYLANSGRTVMEAGGSIANTNVSTIDLLRGGEAEPALDSWLTNDIFLAMFAKPAGSGVPKLHKWSPEGGTVIYTDMGGTAIANGAAAASLQIGEYDNTDIAFGWVFLLGWWEGIMSATDVDDLYENRDSNDWLNLAFGAPKFFMEFNDDPTDVVDQMGNASNKTLVGRPYLDRGIYIPGGWTYATQPAHSDMSFSIPTQAGKNILSGAAAWGFGSWVEIVPGWDYDIAIRHLDFQITEVPTVDTTREALLEIGTGAAGSEVTKVQLPYSWRSDTAVGVYQDERIYLPEPVVIPAGTRIAARVADSVASALTYHGVNIFALEVAASATPIAGSDTVGAGTESGSVVVVNQVSDTDSPTSPTEIATHIATIPATDVNGVPTETSIVDQTKAAADSTSAGSDTGAMIAAEPGVDLSGGTNESGSVVAVTQISGSDASATGVDAATILAVLVGTDQRGTLVENQVVLVTPAVSDTNGATIESASYRMDVNATDVSGAVVETAALLAALAALDSAGAGVDNGSVLRAVAVSDANGAVTEATAVVYAIAAADSGSGGGEVAVLTAVTISASDSATDSESGSLSGIIVTKQGDDVASGLDLATMTMTAAAADIIVGAVDVATLAVNPNVPDAGSALDNAAMIARFVSSDSPLVQEIAALIAAISSGDVGSATDSGAVSLRGIDTALAVELQEVSVGVEGIDTAVGLDNFAQILRVVTASESVQGLDFGIRLIRGLLDAIETGRVVVRNQSGHVVTNIDSGRVRS